MRYIRINGLTRFRIRFAYTELCGTTRDCRVAVSTRFRSRLVVSFCQTDRIGTGDVYARVTTFGNYLGVYEHSIYARILTSSVCPGEYSCGRQAINGYKRQRATAPKCVPRRVLPVEHLTHRGTIEPVGSGQTHRWLNMRDQFLLSCSRA